MKKNLALWLVFMMILPVCAWGEETSEPDIRPWTGIWSDENNDRAFFTILPMSGAWTDDRMGEEPEDGALIVQMHWGSSAYEATDYRMTGLLDASGNVLAYTNGLLTETDLSKEGEDQVTLLEDAGEGAFTMDDSGKLTWKDSCVFQAGEFVLTREEIPVPGAEEIAGSFFRKIAGLETGSAGADLKKAQLVQEIFSFCGMYSFWCADAAALAAEMNAACDSLSDEEAAAYGANAGDVLETLLSLTDENTETDAIYADAGVEESILALRHDMSARMSLETLIHMAETLENTGDM